MSEPAAVFAQAQARIDPVTIDWTHLAPHGVAYGACGIAVARHGVGLQNIIGEMAVMACGGSFWQPHPAGSNAPSHARRLILAVREGPPIIPLDLCPINPDEEGASWRALHNLPKDRRNRAVLGCHILDCLALDPTLRRPPLRLTGDADVLGYVPEWGLDPDGPVQVHRTIAGWLTGGCRGLVLLGNNAAGHQEALLRCTAGIVGEDLAHATTLKRLMERPIPVTPPIYVAERVAA